MKKKIIIILVLFIILVVSVWAVITFLFKKEESKTTTEGEIVNLVMNNISGNYSSIIVKDFVSARESLSLISDELNIDLEKDLKEDRISNSNYLNTYSFKQLYRGIPVYNGDLIVYTDKDGNVAGVINKLREIDDISVEPKIKEDELDAIIMEELGNNTKVTSKELVIYPTDNKFILAYICTIDYRDNGNYIIIIDANTKKIIKEYFPLSTYEQEELDYFLDDNSYYKLLDEEKNIFINKPSSAKIESGTTTFTIYSWHKNAKIDTEKENAINAIVTIQKCYNYYLNKFNYLSLDNQGMKDTGISVITHVKTLVLPNETVSNFQDNAGFIYPNIIALGYNNLYNDNIEVIAHEYTHGVFDYITASYENDGLEKKALSEAYADIMGMIIEAYYNENEKIDGYISSKNGRNIKDANMAYSKDKKFKEEHDDSVIISKAAYLMNEKLSLDDLANLWFYSMRLLPSNPTYLDCYYAVTRSAVLLGFSNEEKAIVEDAFKEVGFATELLNTVREFEDKLWNQTPTPSNEEETTDNEPSTESNEETNSSSNNNSPTTDNNSSSAPTTKTLTEQEAVTLITNNVGDWKGVKRDFEYTFKVKDKDGNLYYAINAYAHENFMNYGGEWLGETDDGRFYAGTYYVPCTYEESRVVVGYNARDYQKYKEGDTVSFLERMSYNID